LEWICIKEVSFSRTNHLRNPLNENKPVRVSRDAQELVPKVGYELCKIIDTGQEFDLSAEDLNEKPIPSMDQLQPKGEAPSTRSDSHLRYDEHSSYERRPHVQYNPGDRFKVVAIKEHQQGNKRTPCYSSFDYEEYDRYKKSSSSFSNWEKGGATQVSHSRASCHEPPMTFPQMPPYQTQELLLRQQRKPDRKESLKKEEHLLLHQQEQRQKFSSPSIPQPQILTHAWTHDSHVYGNPAYFLWGSSRPQLNPSSFSRIRS